MSDSHGRTPSEPEPTGPTESQAQGPDFAPPGADDTQELPTAGASYPEPTVAIPHPGGTTVQPG